MTDKNPFSSPLHYKMRNWPKTPDQNLLDEDLNFPCSQVSDSQSQAEVKWDCSSPDAARHIHLFTTENGSQNLSEMLKLVPSELAQKSSTPPLLGLWMHKDSSPKRKQKKPITGRRIGRNVRLRGKQSSSIELLQRLAAVIDKQKEEVRIEQTQQERLGNESGSSDVSLSSFPSLSHYEPSQALDLPRGNKSTASNNSDTDRSSHSTNNLKAASVVESSINSFVENPQCNISVDMFSDESWENLAIDKVGAECGAESAGVMHDVSSSKNSVYKVFSTEGDDGWDDDDLFNESFIIKATQMTDALFDKKAQKFRTPKPKSFRSSCDSSRNTFHNRGANPQNIKSKTNLNFGQQPNTSAERKDACAIQGNSNLPYNQSNCSGKDILLTTKKTHLAAVRSYSFKPSSIDTSSPSFNKNISSNWKDTSLTDELLMQLAEPDDSLEIQATQIGNYVQSNKIPTDHFSIIPDSCVASKSHASHIASSILGTLKSDNSTKTTSVIANSTIQNCLQTDNIYKADSLGFDVCDDDDDSDAMLSEPAILAMLDQVESQASQNSKTSSQTQYSADDIEKKKLAAVKRRQEKVNLSQNSASPSY